MTTKEAVSIIGSFVSLVALGLLQFNNIKNDIQDIKEDKIGLINERLKKLEQNVDSLKALTRQSIDELRQGSDKNQSLVEKDLALQERRIEEIENSVSRLRIQLNRQNDR